MKRFFMLLSIVFITLFLSSPHTFAQPSEESLLSAWEALQKNNPKTVVFEKLGERDYKFKTQMFPFDGELKVTNVVVDNG